MNDTVVQHIKSLGYRVFVPAEPMPGLDTYLYYTTADGKKIGYYQLGPSYAYDCRITTVHKPCREHGTGYIIGTPRNPARPTQQDLDAGHCFAPPWARDTSSIVKYKDIEEFTQKHFTKLKEL